MFLNSRCEVRALFQRLMCTCTVSYCCSMWCQGLCTEADCGYHESFDVFTSLFRYWFLQHFECSVIIGHGSLTWFFIWRIKPILSLNTESWLFISFNAFPSIYVWNEIRITPLLSNRYKLIKSIQLHINGIVDIQKYPMLMLIWTTCQARFFFTPTSTVYCKYCDWFTDT